MGRATLTVHQLAPPDPMQDAPALVGLIVSKAVGGSVVRSRVSRRLRHLLRDRLAALEPGVRLVVRAAPAAADSSSQQLGADLDAALRRLTRSRRPAPPAQPASPGSTP